MPGASASSIDITENTLTPQRNTRRRPKRSASVPAAIRQLPNASMNALVIQLSATGPPPSARPIAGVEMAPAEKLSGRITAATQTAANTAVPRETLRLIGSDMSFL